MRILVLFILHLPAFASASDQVFSFHVNEEPAHLNPFKVERLSGSYVLGNLFSGFLAIDKNLRLQPALAERCWWKNPKLAVCKMRKNKWSNGEKIPLKTYAESLNAHLKLYPQSYVSEALLNLDRTQGVKVEAPDKVIFPLVSPDADLFYKMSVPAFSPLPEGAYAIENAASLYSTGPYQLKKWEKGKALYFSPNNYSRYAMDKAPQVTVFFIAEDNTALSLFEKGELNLLRRLTPAAERRFQGDQRMRYIPFLRFDYMGFSGSLKNQPQIRQQLTESLDYLEFQKVFNAQTPPGCFSLPATITGFKDCYHIGKPKKLEKPPTGLKLYFSEQGGDNLMRSMQWYQHQWKKHLGIVFRLEQEDYKALTYRLRNDPPDAFRRGVPLDRPTCLAALEVFESGSADNFVKFKNKAYDEIVKKLREVPSLSAGKKKGLCKKALKLLFDSHQILPMGEIHIPVLFDKKFQGWKVNPLNQLDLSGLRAVSN